MKKYEEQRRRRRGEERRREERKKWKRRRRMRKEKSGVKERSQREEPEMSGNGEEMREGRREGGRGKRERGEENLLKWNQTVDWRQETREPGKLFGINPATTSALK